MARTLSTYLVSTIIGGLVAGTLLTGFAPSAHATRLNDVTVGKLPPSRDCAELLDLFAADQADRFPQAGKSEVDWKAVEARDADRRKKVLRLHEEERLRTNVDFYRAAVIMQHGKTPDDFLLAHEFAGASVALGRLSCRWLVAATEDRFLLSIGRPQRFGTQYQAEKATPASSLHPVEGGVTDSLRRAMDLPTLQEAKEKEAAMARLAGKGQI
ncbi:MAG: hypothetical protein ACO1SV_23240 [Fimbriimonas sp.]